MRDESERPSGEIEGLPPALSELPWSPDFVMQAIELLPVLFRDGTIFALSPSHSESFVVGWPAGARPDEVALKALERLGMDAVVLHSTSWRHVEGEAVLTYLAVLPADAQTPASWTCVPAARTDLARGDATAPPPVIGVGQMIEHALRHLSWLAGDDPVIAGALPEWRDVLARYAPEPFRSFGEPQ